MRDIAGHALRAMRLEDQALHLCYHGAQHFWGRFSYLADFAHIVAQLDPLQWNAVLAGAKEQGISRMFIIALYLAQRLLALPLPANIANAVERIAPAVRWTGWCIPCSRAMPGNIQACWEMGNSASW